MMARTIAVRTIRVEAKASDDRDAKAGLARDRVLSMFNMQREREVDEKRKGLALASIFGAKPRPMWSAPALVATFGDPFIQGTMFEGSRFFHSLMFCMILAQPAFVVADSKSSTNFVFESVV